MIIIITIISQFIIHQFSSNMMNETQVINYISFSGTIVSLILAILAIMYSFIQTGTQQSNADRIALNITSLNGTTELFSSSASEVVTQIEELNNVVMDIRKLPDSIVTMISEAIGNVNKKHVNDMDEIIRSALEESSHKQKQADSQIAKIETNNHDGVDSAIFSMLFTTIAMCILIKKINIYDLPELIGEKFPSGSNKYIEACTYISGAYAALSAFQSLGILVRERSGRKLDPYFYLVKPKPEDNQVYYNKVLTLISVYCGDAVEDFTDLLNNELPDFFISVFDLSENETVSNEDIDRITKVVS